MSKISKLVVLCVGAALMLGCRADTGGLATVSAAELADMLAASDVVACDANNADTRERYGVIPGATLLSNYRDYDAVAELPRDTDTQLVFYCHSAFCGAAVDAARKAVAAGHRKVAVFPEGIQGWTEAAQPVARPPAARKADA